MRESSSPSFNNMNLRLELMCPLWWLRRSFIKEIYKTISHARCLKTAKSGLGLQSKSWVVIWFYFKKVPSIDKLKYQNLYYHMFSFVLFQYLSYYVSLPVLSSSIPMEDKLFTSSTYSLVQNPLIPFQVIQVLIKYWIIWNSIK